MFAHDRQVLFPYTQTVQVALLLALLSLLTACPRPTVLYTSSVDTLIAQGQKAESMGNIRDAKIAYTEAAKISGRGYMYLGNMAYKEGNFAEAEKEYRKALFDTKNSATLYNNLAWSLIRQKHKLNEAEEFAMLAVQRSSDENLAITWETLNTVRAMKSEAGTKLPNTKFSAPKSQDLPQNTPSSQNTQDNAAMKALQELQKPLKQEGNAAQEALYELQSPPQDNAATKAIQELNEQSQKDKL